MRVLRSHTDEELFRLLHEDDTAAFNELYSRYWKNLYKYIRAGVGNDELAQDLLQDVFIKLWNLRHTLTITSSLNDYIFRIAKSAVIKHFRSEGVWRKYAAHFAQTMSTHDNSNEEQQRVRDIESSIERSIAQLPTHYQTAFRLSRYEHVPTAEIAQRMNISPRTVENYISHALKHLRTNLGEFMVVVFLAERW